MCGTNVSTSDLLSHLDGAGAASPTILKLTAWDFGTNVSTSDLLGHLDGAGAARRELEVDVRHQERILRQIESNSVYRGTSLLRRRNPLGPHHRRMPRVLGGF